MAAASTGETLEQLAASLVRARGDNFFLELAAHLAGVLDATEALICEAAPNKRARSLGVWRSGGPAANYEYDLDQTPCAAVHAGEILTVELAAGAYPGAFHKSGGYFGMPLAANDGAVLGHLCVYTDHPVVFDPTTRAVCDIIANRAAAELRLVHVKRERGLLRGQRRQLRAEIAASHDVEAMVGVSAAHLRVVEEIRHAAQATSSGVLIRGEPGTGKELVARAIHATSSRAAKPFVKVDCAALYIEAQLNALPQTLTLTNGGTLFLDEVGALSPEMQQRLLANLDAGTNVRIIASTGRDVRKKIRDGEFRNDLYQRLAIFAIDLAPLRTRVEDIPLLVQSFAQKYARRLGRRVESVDPASLAELANYAWPGNIRELANLVERSLVMQDTPTLKITKELLATTAPLERAALVAAAAGDTSTTARTALAGPVDFDDTLSTGLHVIQRDHILRVLDSTHWVIEGSHGAALKLGLKPATLRHRMKKLGISRAANAGPHIVASLPESEVR
jgi:transcriptional regulator with GAF, ATPase, and Fis domain